MQALPNLFDVWADGVELVIFEELGCGHRGAAPRRTRPSAWRCCAIPKYRARFRREWRSLLAPRVYHRNIRVHAGDLACPDASLAGRSFDEIARRAREDAVDVVPRPRGEHGPALRWYSIMANDRPGPLQAIVSHPDVLIGFSDAGAHLRQMAHYNYPLRLLKLARDAERAGVPFMSIERAVHRCTGEIGEWLGLDAGVLGVGRRADDRASCDPGQLDDAIDTIREEPMPELGAIPAWCAATTPRCPPWWSTAASRCATAGAARRRPRAPASGRCCGREA
jgi:N-acyl-D-aspartate/D-glutamate deacylase